MIDTKTMVKIGSVFLVFCLSGSLLGIKTGPGSDEVKTIWSITYFGEGEEDYLYRPSDLAADHENSLLYVIDSGNNRVVVFDFDGKFVRAIGKEGQGPGEFSRPTGACVFGESQLAVADLGNNRIQIFTGGGRYHRSIPTKLVRVADLVVRDDLFYTVPSFGTSGFNVNFDLESETQPLLTVLDQEGSVVREFRVSDFPEPQPFIRALKHRVAVACSPKERFFLPHANYNLIQVFDKQGEKLGHFERSLPFKPIEPQLQSQRTGEHGGQKVVQMRARLDQISQSAQFGPDGILYILTYTASLDQSMRKAEDPRRMPPMPMRFDVIDPQSYALIRTLPCDPSTRAFAPLDAGRLAYVHEDEAGELILKCVQY